MYNFVSVNVKCPHCGVSLMDDEYVIDNEPSILMDIELKGKRGTIRLSSVYGSFNYLSTIELPLDQVVHLSCPHCKTELKSAEECDQCQAHMIPFILDIGGKVSICSRVGCNKHMIGFEDLSLALQTLHDEHETGKQHHDTHNNKRSVNKDKAAEHNEMIKTGTFHNAYCPYCKKSLVEDEQIYLKLIKENGDNGIIMLSPYMNVFASKSTINNPENTIAKDILCYHCDTSLLVKDKICKTCGSAAAKINISARTKFIDFYICSKKGCKWHGLDDKDVDCIRLEDSQGW
jgi:hypothetical protein